MSDTNFSYMEVSAKRKKRNQFISVLIIVAIVLMGVIVWGWIELQKSRNAERIKNALNSQMEPGIREPEAMPDPIPEMGSPVVQDTLPAPEIAEAPKTEALTPEARPIEEVKPVPTPAPEPKAPVAVAKPEPAAPAPAKPRPAPVRPAKPEPENKPAPEKPAPEQVALRQPDPIPAKPAPAKAFPPEDLPLPAKVTPTEEARQAMAASPSPALPMEESAPAAEPVVSATFKQGMAAYRQQDYVNAIRSFNSVPKPASKKRGVPDREEYVQANFLRGMALLKVGHLTESVTAFQNVLEYEKYYPLANMNLGICYVELKQYAKAHQAFEAVIRDQTFIEPAVFDDVMQRTKYFWALAWTRLYKNATNPDKQNYYRHQAVLKWKDYEVWFSKNDKYKTENLKAENYLKSLSSL